MELFLLALASLFSVVNPIGAIPLYISLTSNYRAGERNRSALMISLYFVLLLLAFFYGGSYILGFFGISLSGIKIAGGLIILSSGFALLGGTFTKSRAINQKVRDEAAEKEDISFTPMAMPMLSGPGSIALLISMHKEFPDVLQRLTISLVILATGLIVYIVLRSSPLLFRFLGFSGLKAVSRIMGFLVMAIGVEYVINGIVSLVQSLI